MSEKSASTVVEDWKFIGILILWLLVKGFNEFMTFLTRFYPFALLFTDRSFHARWHGAEKMLNVITLASVCYNNHFYEDHVDRDQYYYQIWGHFDHKPNKKIFEGIEKLTKDKGLEIIYQGEVEEGKHKFIAHVDQNWRIVEY